MLKSLLGIAALCILFASDYVYAGMECYAYSYNPNLVRAVQEALVSRKLDPGPVDGRWGEKTRHAVERFQIGNGILVPAWEEGQLTNETLSALLGGRYEDFAAGVNRTPNPTHAPEDVWRQVCR